MSKEEDIFLDLFNEELNSLNESFKDFGREFPRAVSSLKLAPNSPDPHIRLLTESFAFLVARIGARVEKFKYSIPEAFLNKISPGLIESIPSISFAKFEIDSEDPPTVEGFKVEKNSCFTAIADNNLQCKFSSCYDVDIYPLHLSLPHFESADESSLFAQETKSVISFSISGVNALLSDIKLDKLRIFIDSDYKSASIFRELILGKSTEIFLVDKNTGKSKNLGVEAIKPVGFDIADSVLYSGVEEHPSLRLLRELLIEPNKFMFFDLVDFNFPFSSYSVEILIGLSEDPPKTLNINKVNLANHVTPVINSFDKLAEPIRLLPSKTEYAINPELGQEENYEILRVNSLKVSMPGIETAADVPNVFDSEVIGDSKNLSWHVSFANDFKSINTAKVLFLGDLNANLKIESGIALATVTCRAWN